jgi:hypothetical protein
MTVLEPFPGKGGHDRGQLGVDRLFDQLARAIAEEVSERVGCKTRWVGQLGDGSLLHVAYPFLGRDLMASEHRHDMPPLSASQLTRRQASRENGKRFLQDRYR